MSPVPSAPPQKLTARSLVTTNSIPVTWQPIPIEHTNGFIIGYTFSYWLISIGREKIDKPMVHVRRLTGQTLSLELNNLEMFAKYGIEIFGFTKKGNGPAAFTTAGEEKIKSKD